jgi:hypothetical protein
MPVISASQEVETDWEDCGLRQPVAKKLGRSISTDKLSTVVYVPAAYPSYAGGSLAEAASPGQKLETLSGKITKARRAGGMAQVLKHQPSK